MVSGVRYRLAPLPGMRGALALRDGAAAMILYLAFIGTILVILLGCIVGALVGLQRAVQGVDLALRNTDQVLLRVVHALSMSEERTVAGALKRIELSFDALIHLIGCK